jgi:hypothetical protein
VVNQARSWRLSSRRRAVCAGSGSACSWARPCRAGVLGAIVPVRYG